MTFGFLKKCFFFIAMTFFSCNALNHVSMDNQECKIGKVVMNINDNETLFYPYNIFVNKYSGSCNDINNFYTNLCVPYVVENINIKLFNQVSRKNETRYVFLHDTCKCKCRLDVNVYNNKQRWNKENYRSEYKKLIDKRRCAEGFI